MKISWEFVLDLVLLQACQILVVRFLIQMIQVQSSTHFSKLNKWPNTRILESLLGLSKNFSALPCVRERKSVYLDVMIFFFFFTKKQTYCLCDFPCDLWWWWLLCMLTDTWSRLNAKLFMLCYFQRFSINESFQIHHWRHII